jgi:GRAM domain
MYLDIIIFTFLLYILYCFPSLPYNFQRSSVTSVIMYLTLPFFLFLFFVLKICDITKYLTLHHLCLSCLCRIFITQHYLAFSGWPEMRLLLALKDINNVEKCNTLYYIPNAISINSETYGEFFFGSFIDRDVCYALLNNMSQIAKRLIEIKRDSNTLSPETEQLVFGLRIPKTTGVESYVGAIQAKATAGWNSLPTTVNSLQELSGLRFDDRLDPSPSINPNPVPKPLYLAEGSTEEEWSMVNSSREELNQMQVQGPSSTYSSSNTSSSSTAATTTTAASAAMIDDFSSYNDDGIDISDLFTKHGIQSLCTQVLPFRFPDLLRSCWLHGSGYG